MSRQGGHELVAAGVDRQVPDVDGESPGDGVIEGLDELSRAGDAVVGPLLTQLRGTRAEFAHQVVEITDVAMLPRLQTQYGDALACGRRPVDDRLRKSSWRKIGRM